MKSIEGASGWLFRVEFSERKQFITQPVTVTKQSESNASLVEWCGTPIAGWQFIYLLSIW